MPLGEVQSATHCRRGHVTGAVRARRPYTPASHPRLATAPMLADIVQDRPGLVVGARCSRSLAGLVSFASPVRVPAGPRLLSFVSGGEGSTRRSAAGADAACADPAVHRRVHARVHAARRVRDATFVRLLQGRRRATDRRARRDRVRACCMIGYALAARLDRGSTPSAGRSWRKVRPGRRRAPSRSGWRSPRGGPRASGRSSAGILAIAARRAARRGASCCCRVLAGARGAVPAGRAGVHGFMGAFGWVRRHYAAIAGVSGAS